MKEWINQLSGNEVALYVTFILFVAGVISSILYGYIPNKRRKEIKELQTKLKNREKELLAVYQDVLSLIQIEECLCQEADTSKVKAREGFSVSYRSERKRVEKRITELERQI